MSRDEYIKLISKKSDRYGNKLVDLMDKYHVYSLMEITEQQTKDYCERNCLANG
jgi:hypothetical protein